MGKGWQVNLKRNDAEIRTAVARAWSSMLIDLEKWMRSELVPLLIFGGKGIQGIAQTEFFRFISSPEGLSQLGINKEDTLDLLSAYKKSFEIKRKGQEISFNFGDTTKLKMMTPHPYSGVKNLQVESWLEWVVDKEKVASGFVSRDRLPDRLQKSIRLNEPLGGLMLPRNSFGSTGLWQFPEALTDYDRKWLENNEDNILRLIREEAGRILVRKLN